MANQLAPDLLDLSLDQLLNTKITVASLKEETVSKAPVPVTIINEQMINASGATSLKQLLLSYVPGFTDIEDQNEINVAARGIYTSAQQKILILINGHRMNSYSYSMASPDHSISLDKIKQIEVLRGPASALYGNVSLTATINIRLKSTNEIPNNQVKLLAGNHGQRGVSLLAGEKVADTGFVIWANTYQSKGEHRAFSAENVYSRQPQSNNNAIINGIKDKTPFDLGLTIASNWGNIFFNSRRAHYIEPFSGAGLTGEPYDYDKIEKLDGTGPGFGYTANHFEYAFNHILFGWQQKTQLYVDNFQADTMAVIEPIAPVVVAPSWKEVTQGLISTIETSFSHSSLLFGGQVEAFKVYGADFPLAKNSFSFNDTLNNVLPSGRESNYSLFGQLQHSIDQLWDLNLGIRYDKKDRKATANIEEFSPRLALVYNRDNANVKLSYSEAFVDATYWNRFSNLASFKGAKTLKPEKLSAWQFSHSVTLPSLNVQLSSTLFYDQSSNVIFRDNNAIDNNYSNAGKLNSWGVEQEFAYIGSRTKIHANLTFREATESELIASHHGYIANVPKITGNINVSHQLTDSTAIYLGARYIGKQFTPINIQQDGRRVIDPFPMEGVSYQAPKHYEGASWVINTNLTYQLSKHFSVRFSVENLFNRDYRQGGTTLFPYPKPKRWYTLEATLSF